ncbi:MAG: hydrolase [archaeon]
MMVGHAALAFAIAASVAVAVGWPRDRVLAVGLVAAGFAVAPDADMVYALTGLSGEATGPMDAATDFWGASTLVHRSITHSLVLAIPAGLAFAAWTVRGPWRAIARPIALVLSVGLIVVATIYSGFLGGIVSLAFVATGLLVATLARYLTTLAPGQILAVAWLGLLSHPWGDLFTGEPPAFLYPFDATLVASRVYVHPDPTVHLLAVFGIEMATVWFAIWVLDTQVDRSLVGTVERKAWLGLGYAAAAIVLPPPTVDFSYHFVFSILAVGTVLGAPRFQGSVLTLARHRRLDRERITTAALTGLAAVSLAWIGYAIGYLLG